VNYRTILYAAVGTLIFTLTGMGQVNIERQRRSLDSDGTAGEAALSLMVNSGNSESVRGDAGAGLVIKSGRNLGFAILAFSLGEKSSQRFINKGMGHLRYNYILGERSSGELFFQSEYNEFTLLKNRSLAGTGIRYDLVESEKGAAVLGTGIMGEKEELDREINLQDNSGIKLRSSSYLSFRMVLGKTTEWGNVIYFQPSMDDFKDYRGLADSNLRFSVSDRFSFVFTLNLRYDSKPPEGIKKADLEIKNGMSVNF